MRHPAHEFLGAVVDDFVVVAGHALVGPMLVSMNSRALLYAIPDEGLQSGRASVLSTAYVRTCPSRSFMPTTVCFPTGPRPAFSFLSLCLFFSLPPT